MMEPLKLALIGYGKMGKEIEHAATERGHEVLLKINSSNLEDLSRLHQCDAAIEFSNPQSVVKNIQACFNASVPVVVGTTGWQDHLQEMEHACMEKNGALLYSSNFSIGVNIFFEINKLLAKLMDKRDEYDVTIEEVHHTAKKDKPSGTAITLASQVLKAFKRKTAWKEGRIENASQLLIRSVREDDVVGKHTVTYHSSVDTLTIIHDAKNRKGFASGAVLAAEFIRGKRGIYTMSDVLSI